MNFLKLFGRSLSRSKKRDQAVHMTYGAQSLSSMSMTMSRTGIFLKQHIWIWPIIATVVLAAVAFAVRSAIESTMESNLKSQLQTLLSVEAEMLENWMRVQSSNASSLANNQAVRQPIYKLLERADPNQPMDAAEPVETLHQQLRKHLGPVMTSHDYVGYFVINKSKRVISASNDELVGQQNIPEYDSFVTRALQGEATVSPPFPSVFPTKDDKGVTRTGTPTMFVCAPVRDEDFEVVAVLALRMRPEDEMTRIMQLGRIGASGETYAFDKSGTLVSNSRFDNDLILIGLLADRPDSKSILNIQLRDPEGNLMAGYRPTKRRSELKPTLMAAEATSGKEGVNLNGYRDYRGVPVVGAWKWLPKYGLGIATEIDVAEAYRPLFILQWTFRGLIGLLAISSAAIFVFTIIVARLRREAQKASIEARQLGQYRLQTKLGEGAMGVVYKGHHAMLRRPTAIKLLDLDKVNDASIQRFEREVQITCQLNHPNTVAIYDYGRTPEGVFYYAMEYLDGINLQTLVDNYGPQPEGRVIHIMLQLCGSLFEAHSLGLVHRDIKPANLMLNRRGCESDVLKVLDFGLVKAIDEEKQINMTSANSLTGTPLYMAPEAIQSPNTVDGRSDLYAVGAVGYFLLTGSPVFTATGIVELCHQHVDVQPMPPSQRLGKPVSQELENAILSCLEKLRSKRPPTARDLAVMLSKSVSATEWTQEEADTWWSRHERGHMGVPPGSTIPATANTPGNTPASTAAAGQVFDRTMVSNQED